MDVGTDVKKEGGKYLKRMLVFMLLICLSILISCQSSAVKDSDIIFNYKGEITSNQEKFEKFIENVTKGKEDGIRIVRYTIEGDPIFDTLNFTGEEIKYIRDNSHDEFGGSDKGEKHATCARLESEETDKGTNYFLVDCSAAIGNYFELKLLH